MVKASASRAEGPGFESRLSRDRTRDLPLSRRRLTTRPTRRSISRRECNRAGHACIPHTLWRHLVCRFSRSGCLDGLVVKASAPRAEDPRFESRLRRDFSGSSHTNDFKIGTPVATLPGAWRYRVSTGTGLLGVSILWLGEEESWICNFYLSVAARKKCLSISVREIH